MKTSGRKLNMQKATAIRIAYKMGNSIEVICRCFEISPTTFSFVVNYRSWK